MTKEEKSRAILERFAKRTIDSGLRGIAIVVVGTRVNVAFCGFTMRDVPLYLEAAKRQIVEMFGRADQ